MIHLQPVVLVSEFFQHVVMIVLAGYLCVELLVSYFANRGRRDEVTSLLIGVIALGVMIIGEYFLVLETPAHVLLLHLPAFVAGCYALVFILRARRDRGASPGFPILETLFMVLVPLLVVEVGIDLYTRMEQVPSWSEFVTSFIKTAEVTVLYFFVLIYTIRMDEAGCGALTCTHDAPAAR